MTAVHNVGLVGKMARRFPRRALKTLRQRVEGHSCARSSLGVITGCQSSGTTLLLRLLDGSLATRTYNEDHPLAFRGLRIRSGPAMDRLLHRAPCPLVMLKSPCDAHRLGDLLDSYAGSVGIWVFRGYRDVAASWCRRWPGNATRFVTYLVDGKEWEHWIAEGVKHETVQHLVSVWDSEMDDFNAACLIWWVRNLSYFDQHVYSRDDVLTMEYEALLEDPFRELTRVSEFLGVQVPASAQRRIRKRTSSSREHCVSPQVEALCEQMLGQLRGSVER